MYFPERVYNYKILKESGVLTKVQECGFKESPSGITRVQYRHMNPTGAKELSGDVLE